MKASGGTRINRTSILSKERNRFSLVYTWSWNHHCMHVYCINALLLYLLIQK